jgi:hypothetical protein
MIVVVAGALFAGLAYTMLRGAGKEHVPALRFGWTGYPNTLPSGGAGAPPASTEEALAYNVVMPFPVYDTGLVPSSSRRSTSR